MNRIEKRFKTLRESGEKAFIPYIMAGDPSLEVTEELVSMLEREGADIIELGVPFSDPLADGPTIQAAAERALSAGVTLKKVLTLVKRMRKRGVTVPIVLMTYMNPIHAFGEERFLSEAKKSGVDGLIIPDLPPDEGREFAQKAGKQEISVVFLLAPTSTDKRIKLVSSLSRGFIYYVSLTGITGAKININNEMKRMINKIKSHTNKPVCIGFGVKTPQEAARAASFGDGVIVGSAIVKMADMQRSKLPHYIKSLRKAI